MNRDAQGAVLGLLGGVVLRMSLDGTYLRYVKEGLRPFLFASGVLLFALGVASLLTGGTLARMRAGAAAEEAAADGAAGEGAAGGHGSGETHQHPHGHGPAVAWLLVLPVLVVFLVAPPALGSYAAERDAGTVARPAGGFAPLPAGDPLELALSDYAGRAVWEEGRSLQGRTVRIVGFASPRAAGGWYLTRMALSCCAADGQATKVEVRGAGPLPADQWAAVTGTYLPSDTPNSDRGVARIQASALQRLPEPPDPYE